MDHVLLKGAGMSEPNYAVKILARLAMLEERCAALEAEVEDLRGELALTDEIAREQAEEIVALGAELDALMGKTASEARP
jgi:hypothetical protein